MSQQPPPRGFQEWLRSFLNSWHSTITVSPHGGPAGPPGPPGVGGGGGGGVSDHALLTDLGFAASSHTGPLSLAQHGDVSGDSSTKHAYAQITGTPSGGYGTIDDEGTAVAQRATADFIGAYTQAWDDAANTITRVRTGYSHYDAIVNSDEATALYTGSVSSATATSITVAGTPFAASQFIGCRVVITSGAQIGKTAVITANTTSQISYAALLSVGGTPSAADTFIILPSPPVFKTLQSAIWSGAVSIFFCKASGEADITIASTDAVTYIASAKPSDSTTATAITVSIACDKSGVLFQNLFFAGTSKVLTLGLTTQQGIVALGCLFTGTHTVALSGPGCSLVACVFTAMTSAVASVAVSRPDCRVQACLFQLSSNTGGHIVTTAGTGVAVSVVGNIFFGSTETGYFAYMNDGVVSTSGGAQSSINGNIFEVPATATGALSIGDTAPGLNISGNVFRVTASSSSTQVIVNGTLREIIGNNVFVIPSLTGTASIKVIAPSVDVTGHTIGDNVFYVANSPASTATLICIELANGAGGAIISGNSFILVSASGTGNAIGLNALDTDYLFTCNNFSSSITVGGFGKWKPITTTTPGAGGIGPKSVIFANPGLPDIGTYQAKYAEDFVIINAQAVAPPFAASTHLGWKTVVSGAAAITNAADKRNGLVTLAAGATINKAACLFLDSNHVVVNTADASWQVNLPRISSVENVRIRIGFMPRATFVTIGAGGVGASPFAADYFLLEYDTTNDIAITNCSVASPTVVTTGAVHGLVTGDQVNISGSTCTPSIDGLQTVTVLTTTTFTVPVNVTISATTGIVHPHWQMRWRSATGTEVVKDTKVVAQAAGTQLLMGVDRTASNRPWAYVNGVFFNPNVAATGVPSSSMLMTMGAYIECLAAADKQIDVDAFFWGDDR